MIQIYPVPDFPGKVVPNILVLKYIIPTGLIVLIHPYFLSDIFFGNSQSLLHLKLYRKTVRIPSRFSFYEIALKCFVSAKHIFKGTANNVVNTRLTIC